MWQQRVQLRKRLKAETELFFADKKTTSGVVFPPDKKMTSGVVFPQRSFVLTAVDLDGFGSKHGCTFTSKAVYIPGKITTAGVHLSQAA